MGNGLKALAALLATLTLLASASLPAGATANTQLQQVISTGTLSTDILDAGQATVSSPSISLSSLSVSATCQTATGTHGTNTQRIYVDNPGASATGWVLSLAATAGATATWTTGSQTYDFNDPSGSGCTGGQMTVNPSGGTITAQSPSTTTGVSLGTSAAFNQGTTDSIELANAGASSDDIWRGYLTNIAISQKVPASKPAGTYTLSLTQTVVAQ
jgi:hypothetical protein